MLKSVAYHLRGDIIDIIGNDTIGEEIMKNTACI